MEVDFQVGPIPSAPARSWLHSSMEIVRAIRATPDAVVPPIPPEVIDLIQMYLTIWSRVATAETFVWTTRVDSFVIQQVAENWRRITSMGDDALGALGCEWPPPEAVPFREALFAGSLGALEQDPELVELVGDLRAQPPGAASDGNR